MVSIGTVKDRTSLKDRTSGTLKDKTGNVTLLGVACFLSFSLRSSYFYTLVYIKRS